MPWTEKQLKLFRAAAHDPKIARARGIKQAAARRMMGEGLKKASGGVLKQAVGERDTKHGLLDLPVSLPPAAKKPKMRFAEGGSVSYYPEMGTREQAKMREVENPDNVGRMANPPAAGPGQADNRRTKAEQDAARSSTKGLSPAMLKQMRGYARGGAVRSRDGLAARGRTKGTMR